MHRIGFLISDGFQIMALASQRHDLKAIADQKADSVHVRPPSSRVLNHDYIRHFSHDQSKPECTHAFINPLHNGVTS